jgi:coproporphyrinogen III oxidase
MTPMARYAARVERIYAKSPNAATARSLVEGLQATFVEKLQALSSAEGTSQDHQRPFERIDWLRDEGQHGGGYRYVHGLTPVFNRAAVNVSGVHYDDDADKRLRSADALSTIIHPHNPHAPSVHMHFSWTEMRDGEGYYRMMADLNPSISNGAATLKFEDALRAQTPKHFEKARAQGDRYFSIPALQRHRGVSHFYLEGFSTRDFDADTAMAKSVALAAIEAYIEIFREALQSHTEFTEADQKQQLIYHTTYLFQVLTLDRGTTSGLLVHDQNDLGIMGSLPSFVDKALLESWIPRAPKMQQVLVRALADVLPDGSRSAVTDDVRLQLAQVVRKHYRDHPEALELQASGGIIPPTVANHDR